MQLAKANFIDNLGGIACPADPFVAVLDVVGSDIPPTTFDLHSEGVVEGRPIPAWALPAPPSSPAATEPGHTYFSYSMQAGATDVQINVGPKMLASIPLFGERNPWCPTITPEIRGGADVRAGSPAGNPWSHNREGGNIALRDGTTLFLPDAGALEMPTSGAAGAPNGFAYIYRDGPAEPVRPTTGGGCHSLPEGTATTKHFTSWLTD